VEDTQKIAPNVIAHRGTVRRGALAVGDRVHMRIDAERRNAARLNHSATHLLHAALRHRLGAHVRQAGSLVTPERLRFDFNHAGPVEEAALRDIENETNAYIRANAEVWTEEMRYDDAIKDGALAFFGDKYGDRVTVVRMGSFSTELCGGTHVARTGDIGFFKIVSESGVAAGIRRVEAVTAEGALAYTHEIEAKLNEAARVLKASPGEVAAKIQQMQDNVRAIEKELARVKGRLASSQGGDLSAQAVEVNGHGGPIRVLAATIEGADAKVLRDTLDQLKGRFKSAAIVLGSTEGGKVTLIAGVTSDLTSKIKAGDLVNHVATQVGGKGGGRPDMAQAGGTDAAALPAALASVRGWVEQRL